MYARRASRSAASTRAASSVAQRSSEAPSSSSGSPPALPASATEMPHPFPPKASFDGGDLDCGSGLLLLIRRHIDPLAPGELLEFRSTEISVEEDFPAWCRMTGNELVSTTRGDRQ